MDNGHKESAIRTMLDRVEPILLMAFPYSKSLF